MNQSNYLTVLTHTPAEQVKTFTDSILPRLGQVTVLQNRTGLVMVPYQDSVQGTAFHLGEVLVAEARISLGSQEGYGAVLGRDLAQACAIAILDAAWQAELFTDEIMAFVQNQADQQTAADDLLLRQVEATRVEMETF